MSQSILKMEQIVKSFGAVNVLKGVDFDLAKGEVHMLVCLCFSGRHQSFRSKR